MELKSHLISSVLWGDVIYERPLYPPPSAWLNFLFRQFELFNSGLNLKTKLSIAINPNFNSKCQNTFWLETPKISTPKSNFQWRNKWFKTNSIQTIRAFNSRIQTLASQKTKASNCRCELSTQTFKNLAPRLLAEEQWRARLAIIQARWRRECRPASSACPHGRDPRPSQATCADEMRRERPEISGKSKLGRVGKQREKWTPTPCAEAGVRAFLRLFTVLQSFFSTPVALAIY